MTDNELSLEELRNLKERLTQEAAELQHELQIVIAAISNPKRTQLIQELKRQTKTTQHTKELLLKQSQRKVNSNVLADDLLINYYKILSNVTLHVTFQYSTTESCYLYNVDGNINDFKFNITYSSNKAPNKTAQEDEEIKQLKIILTEQKTVQKEIQNGLDFFAVHTNYIPSAILFLKSVEELVSIRKSVWDKITKNYDKYCSIASYENMGYVCLCCTGLTYTFHKILIQWSIKWNESYLSAMDAINICLTIPDDLSDEISPVCKRICNKEKWKTLSVNEKYVLFENIVKFIIDVDSRGSFSESRTYTEYSSQD